MFFWLRCPKPFNYFFVFVFKHSLQCKTLEIYVDYSIDREIEKNLIFVNLKTRYLFN